MKIRIQTKLVGLLLVVALVPLCLLAGVAYYSWQENQEREIGAALGRTAGQTMDLVDRLLFFCQEDLQAWALTEAMQDAVAEDADGRITATLMRLKKGYGIYSGIYCVSPEGKIIASSEPESLGADVAGTPWFKAAKTADGAVCHGLINEPLLHGFAVGFTTPVRAAFDTGDGNAPPVIAYLSSRLNWSELFSITSNLQVVAGGQDERGYAVLIDDQGYLLSGPGFLLAEESADPDRMSMVNLAGLVSAASDEINESGYAVVPDTLDQSALVGYAMSQGYQGFAGLGWGTVVVERTDVAFAPIRQLRWQFLLLLGATAGLVVVLAWISARHVSVPIRRLTDVALAIGAGDLDQSIDLRSGDEIGELAVTINQTTRRLKQARGDLMAAKEYTDSILRSLSNGVLSIDLDGRITQVNDAAGRLFAERPDALMGRPLDAIIGDANAWLLASLDKVRAQGSMDMVLDADLTMPGRDLVSVNLATVPLRNQAGRSSASSSCSRTSRWRSASAAPCSAT